MALGGVFSNLVMIGITVVQLAYGKAGLGDPADHRFGARHYFVDRHHDRCWSSLWPLKTGHRAWKPPTC